MTTKYQPAFPLRAFGTWLASLLLLASLSSPANASMSRAHKLKLWKQALTLHK